MGKGDRKTTRGKISISSYGNKRSKGDKPTMAAPSKAAASKFAKPAVKAPVKKAAAPRRKV